MLIIYILTFNIEAANISGPAMQRNALRNTIHKLIERPRWIIYRRISKKENHHLIHLEIEKKKQNKKKTWQRAEEM